MMQVKKFRAATTREALEQIKQELGQDAFVLETKQVRKAGFLGLGKGAMEIEISAAAAPVSQKTEAKRATVIKAEVTAAEVESNILALDDTPAAPTAAVASQTKENDLLEILAARGFSLEESPKAPSFLSNLSKNSSSDFEPAELSPEAPQIVHPKKPAVKAFVPEPAFERAAPTADEIFAPVAVTPAPFATPATKAPASPATVDARELEFLRAELREVKFALGKIAYRTSANEFQRDQNHEFLGGSYESPYHEAYVELAALGVPSELAKSIVVEIIPELRGSLAAEDDIARLALTSALQSRLTFAINPLQPGADRIVAFVGPTGVGKTTTIAKLAARVALQQGRRVELVALDTYRIGAVEQLKTYAEIIGAGCHTVRSVLELDALLRRLPKDAVILIDSTGKSPHDLADQYALAEYLRLNDDIKKCMVIQANTHPVDAASAVRKFQMYGPDYLTVTKFDETERPGSLLEVMSECQLPLAYFCMGQRVPEDLQEATLGNLVSRILPKN